MILDGDAVMRSWAIVCNVHSEPKDTCSNCYIEKVEKRVIEIFGVERDVIYSKRRRKVQVAARSLLCYWVVRKLGLTATELARRPGMTQAAVRYTVIRGE